MKQFCVLLLTGLILLAGRQVLASPHSADTTGSVVQFMQRVQQAYKNAPYLSFDLLYRYANKNQPNIYIDTIRGEIAMDKDRVRVLIDDVETVTNVQYTIQVMKDEKLIYLSTPKPSVGADPLTMLDTAMKQMSSVQTRLTNNKGKSILTMLFPPGQQYKSISITIDESTGFLDKVVYELFTEGLLSEDQIVQNGRAGLYQPEGRIEVLFSNYRQGQFNDSVFNESIYFNRLGKGKYELTEQYKDYQLFLASSKL